MDTYFDKVQKFNKREDYRDDINIAKLLLKNCLESLKNREIFVIGTGLGGDSAILQDITDCKITGIEPRESFQEEVSKIYKKKNWKFIKCDLGEFVKLSESRSGIFLFIHSINHIPKKQIESLKKVIKKSFIIIINPNPEIEKIFGKTDNTVISYLNSKQIKKLFSSEIVFDLFYHQILIKNKNILLREAIVLKTD